MWLTIDVAIILVGMVIIAGGIWITNARILGVPTPLSEPLRPSQRPSFHGPTTPPSDGDSADRPNTNTGSVDRPGS